MDNLSNFLKDRRNEMKLSLRDAAQLIGISHSYLSTLEKGIDPRNNKPVKPTPETLQLISSAYNYPYNDLMRMSGYLEKNKTEESVLTPKDERDIEKQIEKLKKSYLEDSEGLMLSGQPVSPEAIESIIEALSFGIRQAKIVNKKYTPKKYRK